MGSRKRSHQWRTWVMATALAGAGAYPLAAHAQQVGAAAPTTAPSTADSDAAWRQRMEDRMRGLEAENVKLRQQVGEIVETRQTLLEDARKQGLFLAPGTRPVDTTPPDFDVHKYVAEGDFPGSIVIPGTNMSFQVGGFVQLDAIADSNAIGSKDSFVVSSIPTGGNNAGQTNFSAKQTRLFIKTDAPTNWGKLVTFFEGDFFTSDGVTFRLRHAYGQIGDTNQLLGGQTWSTFMDASVYPAIFDYQGPNGMVLVRQPMVRYTRNFGEDTHWQIALEDPNPDFSTADGVSGRQTSQLPDLTSDFRWSRDWGHLQLAGILRQLQFDPDNGPRSTELGWGGNFSGQVNCFEPVAKGQQDNVVFQIAGGRGIANYFNDTNGIGDDAFVKNNGNADALDIWGGFVAYQHFWAPKWASTIGYSYLRVYNVSSQPDGAYQSGHYGVLNLTYYPTERIWLGIEGLYGVRKDKDGNTGDDGRISFSVQYRF